VDNNLQEIRRDIEQTRVALGEKINRLTSRVETTTNTTLNPAYHVRTRPWPTLGITVAFGCLLGRFMRSRWSGSATRHNEVRPSVIREMARNAGSSTASVMGLLVADLLRDFVKERRRKRQSSRS
jgi:predicted RecB family endonuclease